MFYPIYCIIIYIFLTTPSSFFSGGDSDQSIRLSFELRKCIGTHQNRLKKDNQPDMNKADMIFEAKRFNKLNTIY